MSTVADLTPGDIVDNFGTHATFVAATQHPIWPHLQLVIWHLADGTWSHDALNLHQDVGQVRPADLFARRAQLERALLAPAAQR